MALRWKVQVPKNLRRSDVETGMNSVWVRVWCDRMCVTLTWPGGKVGRQESQSVSSQAFSPQISRRYYCHQPLAWQILLFHFAFLYLSALLFLFSFSKTALLLLLLLLKQFCMLHLSPFLACNQFFHKKKTTHRLCISVAPLQLFSEVSPRCLLPPLPLTSLSIVWWICRQGLIIVLQPKCSFFFGFESCDRQGLSAHPPVLLSSFFFYLFFLSPHNGWVK